MAGYFQTPLAKKLGIKPQNRVAVLAAPDGFFEALGPVPGSVSVGGDLAGPHDLDVVVLFCRSQEELDEKKSFFFGQETGVFDGITFRRILQ